MKLDIAIHKGRSDKPAIILIHGLGMDKNFWLDPLNTKIFAKNIPLRVFTATKPRPRALLEGKKITIGKFPRDIRSLWKTLKDEGFNLICWSQKRPVGPISIAVEELDDIARLAKKLFPKTPIALVGHSRGGLITRKFMERKRPEIKAVITISTPHAGSSIARLEKYLKPFSSVIRGILPRNTHGRISGVIKNITDLLKSNALKELLPDSGFFKNLRDSYQKGVNYMSFGGTEPKLFTIYVWKRTGKIMYPKSLLLIPDSLLKIVPSFLVVDEITHGKGDGLVSAESSLLPWASKHYNLNANHVSVVWDSKTINNTIRVLRAI